VQKKTKLHRNCIIIIQKRNFLRKIRLKHVENTILRNLVTAVFFIFSAEDGFSEQKFIVNIEVGALRKCLVLKKKKSKNEIAQKLQQKLGAIIFPIPRIKIPFHYAEMTLLCLMKL
jgi:hypothetical protein